MTGRVSKLPLMTATPNNIAHVYLKLSNYGTFQKIFVCDWHRWMKSLVFMGVRCLRSSKLGQCRRRRTNLVRFLHSFAKKELRQHQTQIRVIMKGISTLAIAKKSKNPYHGNGECDFCTNEAEFAIKKCVCIMSGDATREHDFVCDDQLCLK